MNGSGGGLERQKEAEEGEGDGDHPVLIINWESMVHGGQPLERRGAGNWYGIGSMHGRRKDGILPSLLTSCFPQRPGFIQGGSHYPCIPPIFMHGACNQHNQKYLLLTSNLHVSICKLYTLV